MTKEEKDQLIEIIHSQIIKLTKRVIELKDFTGPISPDDAVGRLSRMDAINNKSVFDASMRNVQSRLDQLTQTLRITGNDNFGICTQCHQSIPFERLKLRHEIRMCADCMKK